MDTNTKIKLVIFLFDQYTSLDVVGPYDVLSRLQNTEIYLVGQEKKAYTDSYNLKIIADYSIDEISEADVLLIPGGFGIDSLLNNEALIDWIMQIDKTTQFTVSVCSGSILLAHTGLLDGRKCTTHWIRKDQLSKYHIIISNERYVQDGKYITSAGVSAGIDMALFLAEKLAGESMAKLTQLGIEYDPAPPYNWGSPDKVPKEVIEKIKSRNK